MITKKLSSSERKNLYDIAYGRKSFMSEDLIFRDDLNKNCTKNGFVNKAVDFDEISLRKNIFKL